MKNIFLFLTVLLFVFSAAGCAFSPQSNTLTGTSTPSTELPDTALPVTNPFYYAFAEDQLTAACASAQDYAGNMVPEPTSEEYYKVTFIGFDPVLTDGLLRQRYDAVELTESIYEKYAAFSVGYEYAYLDDDGYLHLENGVGYMLCCWKDRQWSVDHYSSTGGTPNIMTAAQLQNFRAMGDCFAGYSKGIEGCTLFISDSQTVTTIELKQESLVPAGRTLTDEEMVYFEKLFDWNTANSTSPWYNFALKSTFEAPAQLNMFEFFYSAPCSEFTQTDTELDYLAQQGMDLNVAYIHEYPVQWMNEALQQHFGITLEQTEKIGLERWIYNPQTDAYYAGHGDFCAAYPEWIMGIEKDNKDIVLYYNIPDNILGVRCMEVTLHPTENSDYVFLSNRFAGYMYSTT